MKNYSRFYDCGNCNRVAIDLYVKTVEISPELFEYTYVVINTGTQDVHGDILIYSDVFRELRFEDQLLSNVLEFKAVTKSKNREKARAYLKFKCDTWVYSNEWKTGMGYKNRLQSVQQWLGTTGPTSGGLGGPTSGGLGGLTGSSVSGQAGPTSGGQVGPVGLGPAALGPAALGPAAVFNLSYHLISTPVSSGYSYQVIVSNNTSSTLNLGTVVLTCPPAGTNYLNPTTYSINGSSPLNAPISGTMFEIPVDVLVGPHDNIIIDLMAERSPSIAGWPLGMEAYIKQDNYRVPVTTIIYSV